MSVTRTWGSELPNISDRGSIGTTLRGWSSSITDDSVITQCLPVICVVNVCVMVEL